MLRLHFKARQELKQFLHGGAKPRDLSPSVWDGICKGEIVSMSGHTLACLIDGFGFFEIRKILESVDGFDKTIFEAGRIQGALTGTNISE